MLRAIIRVWHEDLYSQDFECTRLKRAKAVPVKFLIWLKHERLVVHGNLFLTWKLFVYGLALFIFFLRSVILRFRAHIMHQGDNQRITITVI